ncbi:CshA/CshB family fibrillar adhesin-related protein [Schaalia hyovaginalis]|uniref:CshA/CshB family fibrillar adhesin-related protein n=2 Tax=Schaalia hyovaginalis TaxID=29316 RepID=UPI0038B2814A
MNPRKTRGGGSNGLILEAGAVRASAPDLLRNALPARAPLPGELPAVFATGGSGRFKESIQWLQWADYDQYFANQERPYAPVLDKGQSKVFTNIRDMGDAGTLVTTCSLSNLQHLGHGDTFGQYNTPNTDEHAYGPLVATIPGVWAGDALDNMYNDGGPGIWKNGSPVWHEGLEYPRDYFNQNRMVIGLANGYAYLGDNAYEHPNSEWHSGDRPTGLNSRVSVDLECSAVLRDDDGTQLNVPLAGLVFADAEASSNRQPGNDHDFRNEWVQAKATQPNVKWRVLDTLRSDNCGGVTTETKFVDSTTVRLMPTGNECVYQNGGSYSHPNGLGGPDAVMFMEGATKATITIQGGGYSAVALGLIIASDYGDAPESYGRASALFQPTWSGGQVTSTTDAFAAGQASMSTNQTILGQAIDAEGYQQHSEDARGDDINGTDDEDGVVPPSDGYRTEAGAQVTQQVTCRGPGRIAGWIDWNHDGSFGAGEKSDERSCTNGSATLTWTVPEDVVRSVDGETGSKGGTYLRVRITNDSPATALKPIGNTTTGEVEDYKVTVRVPTLQLLKEVDGAYASSEVPALAADQWSLEGDGGSSGRVQGQGGTGEPKVVKAGTFNLSETSTHPEARDYATGTWECAATEGTQIEAFSSSVGATSEGRATLRLIGTDRVTCKIVNAARPGSLTWKKTEKDGTTPLGGTSWKLSGPEVPEGTLVADCESPRCASSPYADADPAPGSFKISGLKWGTYSIQEATTLSGYKENARVYRFPQIKAGSREAALEEAIINERLSGSVKWKKADADDSSVLAGSEWLLTGGVALPDGGVIIRDCIAADADSCPKLPNSTYYDSDPAAGSFEVRGLGWSDTGYVLKESKAPPGYAISDDEHEFVIMRDRLDYEFTTAFTNAKQNVPNLPLTGGLGSDLLLFGGGSLLAFGGLGAAIIARRRRARIV